MIQPSPVVPVIGGVYGILSGLPTDALEPVEVVRLEGEGDSVFCRYVDVELSAKFGTWQVSAKSLEPLSSEVEALKNAGHPDLAGKIDRGEL